MLLNKLYEDFVSHTSLNDGLYKTVFIQIEEVLGLIQEIEWKSLNYKVDNDAYSNDFSSKNVTPLYVIDIIQNMFDSSFAFPDNSYIQLDLSFRGKDYSVISDNNELSLPEDLKILKQLPIFNFFLISNKVYDLFSEFDSIFSFTDNFKTKINSIFMPLQKKFEYKIAQTEKDSGEIAKSSVANNLSFVSNLKSNREMLLKDIENIRSEKEKLMNDKNHILQLIRSKEGFELEQKNLKSEYDILQTTYNDYKQNFDKVLDIIAKIDTELISLNSIPLEQRDQTEMDFLITKKDDFLSERIALENSLNDTKGLMDITIDNLNSVTSKVREIGGYSINDINILTEKIKELSTLQDNKYTELVSVENTIKQHSIKSAEQSARLEMADSIGGSTRIISNMPDDKSIVQHLSSPLQPTSVTIVLNYLRYYFVYHATQIASKLSSMYSTIDITIIQALSCKLTLIKYFGVYYKNIFSIIDFADNRVERVNLLEV